MIHFGGCQRIKHPQSLCGWKIQTLISCTFNFWNCVIGGSVLALPLYFVWHKKTWQVPFIFGVMMRDESWNFMGKWCLWETKMFQLAVVICGITWQVFPLFCFFTFCAVEAKFSKLYLHVFETTLYIFPVAVIFSHSSFSLPGFTWGFIFSFEHTFLNQGRTLKDPVIQNICSWSFSTW